MTVRFTLFITLFSLLNLHGQEQFIDLKILDKSVAITTNIGTYQVSPITDSGFEVQFSYPNEKTDHPSFAVVAEAKKPLFQIKNGESYLINGEIELQIKKAPFSLSFYRNGQLLCKQVSPSINPSHEVAWQFEIGATESLYGGGARALGMNRRGNQLELYNRAHYGYETEAPLMNYCLPIVLSSNRYLLHFDNVSKGMLDLDAENKNIISYQAHSGARRYHIIASDNWSSMMNCYTDLTGKQALPPKWAFGNFASRFGYHSQKEVEDLVRLFEEKNVPLDALILDLYWFGKEIQGTMGNLAFYKDSFPEPEKMMADLKAKNIQPILITEPFILNTSKRWQEALEKDILCKDSSGQVHSYDFYFGHTGLIDVFDPKAQEWFWNIYADLHAQGMAGIWGDLGEPEVHPAALLHHGGYSADDLHNAFGHQWAKIIFEGYQKNYPEERLFNLMRAGAAGSQRYGMIPWSGDVNRTWGGLQSQPEIALQMGMQGLAYMHSDLGGFAGDYDDEELYIRWLQYGVFQPIFRPHAQEELASEPVFKTDKTLKIVKKAIDLRYQLFAYNYTLALENAQTGMPMMRPLFFEAPNDSLALICNDTYLWGSNFLVSPVLEKGANQKYVVLPPNSAWYDFYTGAFYENSENTSKSILVDVLLERIPLFVRAGSIIPMHPPMNNLSEFNEDLITYHIYLNPKNKIGCAKFLNDNNLPQSNNNYNLIETEVHFEVKRKKIKIRSTLNKMPHNIQISVNGTSSIRRIWLNKKKKI